MTELQTNSEKANRSASWKSKLRLLLALGTPVSLLGCLSATPTPPSTPDSSSPAHLTSTTRMHLADRAFRDPSAAGLPQREIQFQAAYRPWEFKKTELEGLVTRRLREENEAAQSLRDFLANHRTQRSGRAYTTELQRHMDNQTRAQGLLAEARREFTTHLQF